MNIDKAIEIIQLFKPSFYNKITWTIVIAGLALLGTPLLERVLNAVLKTEYNITITDDADNVIGLILIVLALIYNLITSYFEKFLLHKQENLKRKAYIEKDSVLFEKFLETLPSKGSIEFLKTHSFGDAFQLESLKDLFDFQYEWNSAEYEFINQELEKMKKQLYENVQQFVYINGNGSYRQNNDWFSVIPDDCNDWELPQHIINKIKEMDDLADKVYQSHQNFVRAGKKLLYV